MAAQHESVLFDIADVKVFPLTTDSGASPTYGSAVDVYGAAEASIDPNLVTAELKGDGRVIAKKGRLDRLQGAVTYGRLSLDVLEVILNVAASDPSGTQALGRFSAGVSLPNFGMQFRIIDADNDVEDVIVKLYKCQVTGGSLLGQKTDAFGQPSFQWEAIGLDCASGPWADIMADIEFHTDVTAIGTMT